MQFGLSEEQILLQDNVNRFLDDNHHWIACALMPKAARMPIYGRA